MTFYTYVLLCFSQVHLFHCLFYSFLGWLCVCVRVCVAVDGTQDSEYTKQVLYHQVTPQS